MMKKLVSAILAALMLLSFAGCGGTESTDTVSEAKKIDYAGMTADDLLKDIKDQQNVTLEEFTDLVSTYAYVNITDDMNLEDNITSEAINKLKENKVKLPSPKEYVASLLKSEAPQVRGYAVSCVSSVMGVDESCKAAVKELIKNESDPYVICCALDALANEGGKDAEIGKFIIDAAKNENAKVRRRAALAIGNSTNKTLDGAVDAMISLMDDSDNEVRKVAYQYSGMLEDDRVVEPIVKLLKNEADSELHGSGIEGLVRLWYDYPQHKNTSEAAYRATMDYLRNEPGNDKVPYWTAIGSFASKNEKNYDAWREKATYFNPDEIMQVMTNIVKNTNLNKLARVYTSREIASIARESSLRLLEKLLTV